MKQRMVKIALSGLIACAVSFAEQTWTGRISASMCGTAHMDSRCIQNCIKGGGKYVFVSKGKVQQIQNQDFADLEKHAGHTVKLTGTVGPDGKSVTVSKVETVPTR